MRHIAITIFVCGALLSWGTTHAQTKAVSDEARIIELESTILELTRILESMKQNPFSAAVTMDTKQPTEPRSPRLSATDGDMTLLSWGPSADAMGVAGYKIFRDDVEISVTGCCTFMDKEAYGAHDFTYAVQAYDMAGNLSPRAVATYVIEEIATSVSPTGLNRLVRDLKLSDTGEDVRTLQLFLNTHGFTVATVGEGSPGYESTFFGPATEQALKKFQNAHSAKVLTPFGLTSGTGYLGAKTRELINSMI